MPQSSLRYGGLEVDPASIAVASVAQDHGAAVVSRGTLGTRPWDLDHVIRPRPSQATPLVLVSDAGPGGYGLDGSLPTRGHDCGGVAPAWMPNNAGDRGTTDRGAARPLARRLRSGDLPPGSVPQAEDAAMRELRRARAERRRDRNAARSRRTAVLLRQDRRATGQATGRPTPLRWLAAVVCPTPAPPLVFPEEVRAVTAHTARRQRLAQARQQRVKP
jgi:hypothetical protein